MMACQCPIDEHRRSAVLLLMTVCRSKRKEGDRMARLYCVWIHIYVLFSTLKTLISESISLESSFNCDVLLELTA